jgi:hypothetical protein
MTAVISLESGKIQGVALEYTPHRLIKKTGLHSVAPGALSAMEAEPIPMETKWRAKPARDRFGTSEAFFEAARGKSLFDLRQLLVVQAMEPWGIGGLTEIISGTITDESAYAIHQRPDGIKTLRLRPVVDLLKRDAYILIPA